MRASARSGCPAAVGDDHRQRERPQQGAHEALRRRSSAQPARELLGYSPFALLRQQPYAGTRQRLHRAPRLALDVEQLGRAAGQPLLAPHLSRFVRTPHLHQVVRQQRRPAFDRLSMPVACTSSTALVRSRMTARLSYCANVSSALTASAVE